MTVIPVVSGGQCVHLPSFWDDRKHPVRAGTPARPRSVDSLPDGFCSFCFPLAQDAPPLLSWQVIQHAAHFLLSFTSLPHYCILFFNAVLIRIIVFFFYGQWSVNVNVSTFMLMFCFANDLFYFPKNITIK